MNNYNSLKRSKQSSEIKIEPIKASNEETRKLNLDAMMYILYLGLFISLMGEFVMVPM